MPNAPSFCSPADPAALLRRSRRHHAPNVQLSQRRPKLVARRHGWRLGGHCSSRDAWAEHK
eukprot:1378395-Prymnesium_polylepis.1